MKIVILSLVVSLVSSQTFTCTVRSNNPPSSLCEHPDFTPSASTFQLNLTALAAASRPLFACPSGWTFLEETNSCYKNFLKATYTQASAACRKLGAHLATIHSKAENDLVTDIASSGVGINGNSVYASYQIWIGLNELSGKFKWEDGTELDYTNWGYKEPNHLPGEHCGQLWENGQWNDMPCSSSLRAYVCEKPAEQH